MTDKKKTKHLLITPRGIFAYMWVDKADEYKGQTKYKATIKIEKGRDVEWWIDGDKFTGTTEDFFNAITKIHVGWGGKKLKKNPVKDGKTRTNDEGQIQEGFENVIYMTASSIYKPDKVDAKGKALGKVPIYSGDEGRLAIVLSAYDEGSACKLKSVRLLAKNSSGGGDAWGSVGEEDGYSSDPEDDEDDRDTSSDDREDDDEETDEDDY